MTENDIKQAVARMVNHCTILNTAYKDELLPYEMASARNVLMCLNYSKRDQDLVLGYLHAHGFSYCLDPMFATKNEAGDWEPTPEFACWWGIDQLLSRLRCV